MLQYIHSNEYVHANINAENIYIKQGEKSQVRHTLTRINCHLAVVVDLNVLIVLCLRVCVRFSSRDTTMPSGTVLLDNMYSTVRPAEHHTRAP